jgi:hypothetical protein
LGTWVSAIRRRLSGIGNRVDVIWGLEVIAMEAAQGDRIIVHGRTVGSTDRHGVIVEVRGQGGTPPYLVRFDDGHETIMYPGGDFAVDRGHGT